MRNEGGANNVTSWSINWKDISDIVVCKHESIHCEIHTDTAYGFIQLTVNMILDEIKNQSTLWKTLKIVSYKLYAWSVDAHEIAATYCSLRDLNKDTISEYKSILTAKYRIYEEKLSSLIDSTVTGTYLQYLIGIHIVFLAFNIDFHDYVIDAIRDEKYDVNMEKTPNSRLEVILNTLTVKDIEELLKFLNDFIISLRDKYEFTEDIDLNDDIFWSIFASSISNYDELNIELGIQIEKFIHKILLQQGVELELAKSFEAEKSVMKILNLLPPKLNKVLKKKIDLRTYKVTGLEEQSEYDIRWNKYINESRISNNPRFDSTEASKDQPLVFYKFDNWNRLNESTIVHLEYEYNESHNKKFFIVKTKDSSDEVSIGLLSRAEFYNFIKKNKKDNIPLKYDAIIYGIHASVIKDNDKTIYNKLKDILNDFKNPQGLFYQTVQDPNKLYVHKNDLRDKIVWYMHGDITVWLNYFIRKKEYRVFLMQFADYNATNLQLLKSDSNSKLETGSVYFGGVVLYSENFKGTFIRFFNKMAYDRLQIIIYNLIEKGLLSVDEPENRLIQEKQTKRAFKVLDSVWTKF